MTTDDTHELPVLLTLDECSSLLRLSTSTVRRMIHRGELPALKLGEGPNRPLRIPRSALRAYVQQRIRAS